MNKILYYRPALWIFGILLISNVIQSNPVLGSDMNFRHYGPDEGLSQVSVLTMHIDDNGFLWIGTRFGLNEFDGIQFKTFLNDPWDSTSLINNHVNSIIAGRNQVLWVGTNGGLCKYDRLQGTFEYIHHRRLSDRDWHIFSLARDKENNVWVASSEGVYVIPDGTTTPILFQTDNLQSKDLVIELVHADKQQNIWMGGYSGLFKVAWKQGAFSGEKQELKVDDIEPIHIAGIYQTNDHIFWLCSERYFWKYDLSSGTVEAFKNEYTSAEGTITFGNRSVLAGFKDQLWVSSYLGVFVFDPNRKKFVDRIDHDPENSRSLSDNSIHSMLVTSYGDRWVGTYSGGLNYYSPFQSSFSLIQNSPTQLSSLNSNIINTFCEGDDGNLFIGTSRGGLNIFNSEDQSYRAELIKKNVRYVYMDRIGDLWISSLFNGLIKREAKTKNYFYYNNANLPEGKNIDVSAATNHIVTEDESGQLWVAVWDQLYEYHRDRDHFSSYAYPTHEFWEDHTVRGILQVKDELWLMTATGIQVFDLPSRKFVHTYKHIPNQSNSLPSDVATCGVIDKDGQVWVATFGGISRFDPENKSFKSFSVNDGLPSNMALCMLVDGKNTLWISTSNGLASFDQQKETFKIFDQSNNLQGNAFRDMACYSCKDGSFLFGGVNGFNRFDPLKVKIDSTELRVTLTQLLLFNKEIKSGGDSYLPKELRYVDTLALPYHQNVISIQYTAPDFFNPDKNKYAYILEGFDGQWNEVGNVQSATYTNLAPGFYTFKVKAANDDGKYIGPVTQLVIRIIPPFWATTPFRIFSVLMTLLLILLIHRIRIRTLIRQRKLLDLKVKTRTRIIDDQKRKLTEQNLILVQAEEEVRAANDALQKANDHLEDKVLERTKRLKQQNKKIKEFAFLNSHKVRSPLVRILGLIDLFKPGKLSADEQEDINNKIYDSVKELDQITRKINKELDDTVEKDS